VVNSNYNALAIQVNHRFSNHVQFNAGYTWSHALDFNQNEATFSQNNSPLDVYNLKQEYANSIYNVPSRFTFNGVLDAPWHVGGWAKWLADDWRLSPVIQIQSGLPYTMSTSGTSPGAISSGGGINGSNGTFRIAEVGRNTFSMPGTVVIDLRLAKRFQLTDRYVLEFTGDAFNAFNRQNYTGVNSLGYSVSTSNITVPSGTVTCSSAAPCLKYNFDSKTYAPNFGTLTNSNSNFIYTSRQIQLGVRFTF
jgi:hypothetical protein